MPESTPPEVTYPERLAAVAADLLRDGTLLGPLPLDIANILVDGFASDTPPAASHEHRLRSALAGNPFAFVRLERAIHRLIEANPRRQMQLSSATAYNPGKWLLERELSLRRSNVPLEAELVARSSGGGHPRASWLPPDPRSPGQPTEDVYAAAAREQLTGLAFSGGGIRSATFCLGVLQTLAELNLLDHFDYLSSVSGGGYIHQWFASWVYRARNGLRDVQPRLVPLPRPGCDARAPEQIFWLRRYSAYLTPQRGLFSADTWTMISIWFRNTTLTQVVLFGFLSFVLLLVHGIAHPLLTPPWIAHALAASAAGCLFVALFSASLLGRALLSITDRVKNPGVRPRGSLTTSWILGALILPGFLNAYLLALATWRSAPLFYPVNSTLSCSSLRLWLFCLPDLIRNQLANGLFQHHARYALIAMHVHYALLSGTILVWALSLLTVLLVLTFSGRSLQGFHDLHPPNPASAHTPRRRLILVGAFFTLAAIFSVAIVTGIAVAMTPHLVPLSSRVAESIEKTFTPLSKPITTQQHLAQTNDDGSTLTLHLESSTLPPAPKHTKHGRCVEPGTLYAIFAPPFFFFFYFLAINLQIGLLGRYFLESRREWIARFRGLGAMVCLGWIALTSIAYLGPVLIAWINVTPALRNSSILIFLATHAITLYSGASSKTDGKPSPGSFFGYKPLDLVGMIGAPIAVLLLLVVDSALLDRGLCTHPILVSLGIVVTLALFGWRIDVNEFSMHGFYRNRLARAYLGATNPKRSPDPFTGFDDHTETTPANSDMTVAVSDLLPLRFRPECWHLPPVTIPGQALAPNPTSPAPSISHDRESCVYTGPFPIFSATITLTFGDDLAYQERKGTSFAFTPLYTGYHVGWTGATGTVPRVTLPGAAVSVPETELNGFVPTPEYAYQNRGIQLATAAAISGAAISPNQGFSSQPALAFLMTLFNVRLAWWIANPRRPAIWPKKRNRPTPRASIWYLLRELFGHADDTSNYVSLCDGGKFENMGLYELVRRRCRFIIVCDAEQDTGMTFEGIGSAIRKCRMDFGVEIDLDLRPLQLRRNGFSGSHFQVGTITYPPPPGGGLPGQLPQNYVEPDHPYSGRIIYIKTSLVGDEPGDLLHYKNSHPAFPQDTTLNQWFTESQFESYRRLGQLSAEEALQTLANPGDRDGLAQRFSALPSVPAHPPSRA